MADVSDLLAENRLVEIVGPGGIGKTAVAIAVGRALVLPSSAAMAGCGWSRLETASTADDVNDTLLAALNVTGGEAALVERLRSADALIVLDNCEHVVDSGRRPSYPIAATPRLGFRVLCTSQVPLDVDGETIFELEPLASSDAAELFARRATVHARATRSTTPDDAVHELCRSLDGLPLAIELAAARTKTLSIEEITRRLDDRFNVLRDPTSRRPERRRALKATIRWSYDLLFPDDQRGLWALATFAGGAPLPAVEYVLAALDVPATAAIDVVGRLASRSLVIVDDDARHVGPVPTTRQHSSLRARGDDRSGSRPRRALAAHASWYADAGRGRRQRACAARIRPRTLRFARAERATSTRRSRGARRTIRC